MPKPRVTVVGSFMVDMVARLPRWPRPGESLLASEFGIYMGGKGCNQAIAAARCGAEVTMVGRVGADGFGDQLLAVLAAEGIRDGGIARDTQEGTGIAVPLILPDGQNIIVVAPRANMRLRTADVEAAGDAIRAADVLLLQCEVPAMASLAAAYVARDAGTRVILNAAPAMPVPAALLQRCDAVVVNEIEAEALTGIDPRSAAECEQATAAILRRGAECAVITLGGDGLCAAGQGWNVRLAAHAVPAVDVTAAGDAFCGAFAVGLAEGRAYAQSLAMGNAAGALAVGVRGAAPSLPSRAAIEALLRGAAVPPRS